VRFVCAACVPRMWRVCTGCVPRMYRVCTACEPRMAACVPRVNRACTACTACVPRMYRVCTAYVPRVPSCRFVSFRVPPCTTMRRRMKLCAVKGCWLPSAEFAPLRLGSRALEF
jgi:hypothetical protein